MWRTSCVIVVRVISLISFSTVGNRWRPLDSFAALFLGASPLLSPMAQAVVVQHGEDLSWREYLEDVYGHYHTSASINTTTDLADLIKKSDINFYYKNAHVRIVPVDWPRSYIKTSAVHLKNFILSYNPSITYDSYSWVEVSRFSSTYLWSNFREGYVAPQWKDYRSSLSERKVNYGCWFYLSKGSGIYLNLGRTKVITSRSVLWRYFSELTETNCLRSEHASNCHDKYLCSLAVRHGFDSVQVVEQHEIIICTGCGKRALVHACPPAAVELRSGINASQPCNCSDEHLILNCAQRWSKDTQGLLHNGASSSNKYHPTYVQSESHYRPVSCVSRVATPVDHQIDFNLTLSFLHSTDSMKPSRVHHDLLRYPNKEGDNQYILDINIHEGSYQVRSMDANLSEVFDFRNDDFDVESPNYRGGRREELSNLGMRFLEKDTRAGIKSMLLNASHNNATTSPSVLDRLGVIGYYLNSNQVSGHTTIRQLKDDASCLRVLGCSAVILLASGSYIFKKYDMIAQHTRGYIDAIIVSMPKDVYNEKITHSEGAKHSSSKGASTVVPVLLLPIEQGSIQRLMVRRQVDSIGSAAVMEVHYSDGIIV